MSGIGGPLLCIGDLLSDVGEDGDFTIGTVSDESTNGGRTGQQLNDLSDPNKLQPSHLPQLFQVRLFCLYLVDFYFSIFFGTYNELFSSSFFFVCVLSLLIALPADFAFSSDLLFIFHGLFGV